MRKHLAELRELWQYFTMCYGDDGRGTPGERRISEKNQTSESLKFGTVKFADLLA